MTTMDDCVARVLAAIDLVADHIGAWHDAANNWEEGANRSVFSHTAGNSELSTRYVLIDPILRALGWDLSDPSQCVVEYRPVPQYPQLRVDYALFGADGDLAVLIEAKRIDEHTEAPAHWEQVGFYSISELPRVACVTNGEYWSFLTNLPDGDDRTEKPLSLLWPDRRDTAQRLCRLLGRRGVPSQRA